MGSEMCIRDRKMIWVETPSNPLLKIIDIKKIRESLKDENIIIVCDNTFASPYNQQPINNGADVVIHSSTKYLCHGLFRSVNLMVFINVVREFPLDNKTAPQIINTR